mmetsp:Transcript_14434/g.31293  ORF Transcript_14434/g.31293 Transcript_14434/m.31293 type:complete len:421 (-) Transcript_14434:205-1467(-)
MAKKRSAPKEEDDEEDNVDLENRENGTFDEEEEEEVDDQEGDDDDHDDRRKRKKKKKGKKFKIMEGTTDADRRVLRRRQRELHTEIAMDGGSNAAAGDGGGGADDPINRMRGENNELWGQVRYTREAVLDSENIDLIASKAARQAEKIVQVPRYDAIRLAQSLAKKGAVRTGSSSQFNWRDIGFGVGVCFSALPSHVSFLYGPLDAEYTPKERKKVERRKKQDVVESENEEDEKPEDVDQTGKKKSDGNELSAVEKHITVIRRTLNERSCEERELATERANEYESQLSQDIDDERVLQKKKTHFLKQNSQVSAVHCLFNPSSFTQTVENVFHFSFLLKEGFAGIKTRTAEEVEEFGGLPGPAIRPESEIPKMKPPSQAIVSLNMKDWKDMCTAYNVQESHVPHRVDGKVAQKEKKKRKSR